MAALQSDRRRLRPRGERLTINASQDLGLKGVRATLTCGAYRQ